MSGAEQMLEDAALNGVEVQPEFWIVFLLVASIILVTLVSDKLLEFIAWCKKDLRK